MKVGMHAHETLDQILERKKREFDACGSIFWGYGGTACHPVNQVQPFAKLSVQEQGGISLVMEFIDSKANPAVAPATQFSTDGKNWAPLPKGVSVTGSKYAIVLDEIKPFELVLPADGYGVAIGPSKGKLAVDYLKGRVDKACLTSIGKVGGIKKFQHELSFIAKMKDPYAVFVKP